MVHAPQVVPEGDVPNAVGVSGFPDLGHDVFGGAAIPPRPDGDGVAKVQEKGHPREHIMVVEVLGVWARPVALHLDNCAGRKASRSVIGRFAVTTGSRPPSEGGAEADPGMAPSRSEGGHVRPADLRGVRP